MIQTLIYYCAEARQPKWLTKIAFRLRAMFRFGSFLGAMLAISVCVLAGAIHAQEIVGFGFNRFNTLDNAGPYVQVAAGRFHTLALRADGRAVAWGHNTYGECDVPALPTGITWVQVAAGIGHSVGRRSDGQVMAWGDSTYGLYTVPAPAFGTTYIDVATSGRHALALRSDGQITAWGTNYLGNTSVPPLPLGLAYVQISANEHNSAAVRSDGSVVVWGSVNYGVTAVPPLPTGVVYTQVSVGLGNIAALRSDGTIVTWGYISWLNMQVPVLPTGVIYTKVSIGLYEAMALRSDGVLVGWGINTSGYLNVPLLPVGTTYTTFAFGQSHAVASRSDGTVVCWGVNDRFQCNIPSAPTGLHYVDVVSGTYHVLALLSDGTVLGFGMNSVGETTIPPLPPGTTYTKIDASGTRGAALRSDGAIVAWGQNSFGQNTVPPLPTGLIYTDVSTSPSHLLARRSDGAVVAWGDNSYGQRNVPALPTGLSYVKISAGRYSSLATRSDGSAIAWGGFNPTSAVVPPIAAGLTFSEISAGSDNYFAKLSDGSTIGWGVNTYAQVTLPTLPQGLTFTEVDAGHLRSVALRSDASIVTWGTSSQDMIPVLLGGFAPAKIHTDDGPTVFLTTPSPPLAGSLLVAAPTTVMQGTPWAISLSNAAPNIPYIIDVSASGNWPGLLLGPSLRFPLNQPYLNLDLGGPILALYPGIFQGFMGTTDLLGTATAYFHLPVHPALNGLHFWSAGVTTSPTGQFGLAAISNSVETVVIQPIPSLSNVTPNSGPIAGGYTLSISGSGFPAVTAVAIGGLAASNVVRVSSSLITCTVPTGSLGTRDVNVYFGTSLVTLSNAFTYTPNLAIFSVGPSNPVPGQLMTVTGTGFSNNHVMSVVGIPIFMSNVTSTTFTFLAPNVAACNGVMTLTSPYGQTATVTYGPIPVVIGAFFATGPVVGGSTFSILGYNFQPGTTVRVGGVLATIVSMTPGTPTTSGGITVVAPPSVSTGLHAITVTSASGCNATGIYQFTYY